MTKLLGVLGDPIAHSLSPLIHNHWIREHGLDATYEAMQVKTGDFQNALSALSQRDAVGFNVTLPHKLSAFEACSDVSDAAKAIGAVNTLTVQPDRSWHGHNTDASGYYGKKYEGYYAHDVPLKEEEEVKLNEQVVLDLFTEYLEEHVV